DLDRDAGGRLLLPNLVAGVTVEVVLRLRVPPQQATADLCGFRLTWLDPQQGEQFQTATLRLPAVGAAPWGGMTADARVREQVGLQQASRSKRESSNLLEQGDVEAARRLLAESRGFLEALEATPLVMQEKVDLYEVEQRLEQGDFIGHAKLAKF